MKQDRRTRFRVAPSLAWVLLLFMGFFGVHAQVTDPPEFTQHPARLLLRIGDDIALEVKVRGSSEVTYQWYHNTKPLEGKTGSSLFIEGVTEEDSGKYYVTATNAGGTSYSLHGRVSVRPYFLDKSVARQWMEELLDAIRTDYPAPTVHSRNLFSLSSAMWDAWTAYGDQGTPFIADESPAIPDSEEAVLSARNEAISYAAYRILRARFRFSPNVEETLPQLRSRMELLGYDPDNFETEGNSPAAIGNRIAVQVLAFGWSDRANEREEYADNTSYEPVNGELIVSMEGVGEQLVDPNRWQPLTLEFLILQNGIPVGVSTQEFLGPNWGSVRPFALNRASDEDVYSDPGPPPYLGAETDQLFKDAALEIIEFSSWLDPSDKVMIDVSPGSRHNNTLGANDGAGYPENPYTGLPYEENLVLRSDYGRILAEFWADGPSSETPPGHWNTVANYVTDHDLFEKRFGGEGEILSDLEWDVKLYFAMNAAVSDAAIACWDAKRKYDYVRPITMIRYMGGKGQSSDPSGPSYHVDGLPLKPGLVEVITFDTTAEGQRHSNLKGYEGEIALYCWTGIPENPNTDFGGVDWIRAVDWMPYQRDTFVTPPFGAYTSGHSTFSRAGAEILTAITGDPYFPGGISSFTAKANEFLEFERGPEEDITLTWATYYDAADEAGISRLYGGIHVWADDLNGRIMGAEIGKAAFSKALTYFKGEAETQDPDTVFDELVETFVQDSKEDLDPAKFHRKKNTFLANFFLGGQALATVSSDTPFTAVYDSSDRVSGIEFYRYDGMVEFEIDLMISDDMVDWKPPLSPDLIQVFETEVAGGLKQVVMLDNLSSISDDPRFYRLVIKERY